MAKLRVYDPILKEQIIEAIKYQGLSVSAASKQFGVHHKTIYYWLSKEAITSTLNVVTGQTRNKSDTLLIAKLEQENRELKELLGSTHLDMSKFKKKYLTAK
jgi:transposase-like protein